VITGMCYWRFKTDKPGPWRFGYCTYVNSGLYRMGNYNGDTMGGVLVDPAEIETREYQS
jgi:hypothetical protein